MWEVVRRYEGPKFWIIYARDSSELEAMVGRSTEDVKKPSVEKIELPFAFPGGQAMNTKTVAVSTDLDVKLYVSGYGRLLKSVDDVRAQLLEDGPYCRITGHVYDRIIPRDVANSFVSHDWTQYAPWVQEGEQMEIRTILRYNEIQAPWRQN